MKGRRQLYRIGITGGIGSGKSKLLTYLHEHEPSIFTVNLDLFGHSVYDLNPLVVRNISSIFGPTCLDS
jgi:dephospho-CoA kinase